MLRFLSPRDEVSDEVRGHGGGERERGKGGSRALRGNRSLLKLQHPDRARPERRERLFRDMKPPADSRLCGELSARGDPEPKASNIPPRAVWSLCGVDWLNFLPAVVSNRLYKL